MPSVEISAKTRQEAIQQALEELGAELHEVEIEIVDEGSRGFLGFGSRDVRVRVTSPDQPGRRSEGGRRGGRPERSDRGERPARSERPERGERGGERAERGERGDRGERPARGERSDRGERSERGERPSRSDRGPRSDRGSEQGSENAGSDQGPRRGGDRGNRSERPDRGERPDRPERPRGERSDRSHRGGERPERGGDHGNRAERPRGEGNRGPRPERGPRERRDDRDNRYDRRERVARPEEERPAEEPEMMEAADVMEAAPVVEEGGAEEFAQDAPINEAAPVTEAMVDAAAALMTEIITHMGMEATVKGEAGEDNAVHLLVESPDSALLIGRKGRNLGALQYLIERMALSDESGVISARVLVDVEGYQDRRRQTLEDMALRLADRAKESRREIRLKPLNPQERRIIHMTLQDDPDVRTFSVGEAAERTVVIAPRNAYRDNRGRRGGGDRGGGMRRRYNGGGGGPRGPRRGPSGYGNGNGVGHLAD